MAPASTTAAWAEAYAAVGWRVFPLEPGGKRPLTGFLWRDWATTDRRIVREWFADESRNIGAVTGELFDVFDIEVEHLARFTRWTAESGHWMPQTPFATTGRGGWHILVAPTGRSTTKLILEGTHIGELKARGGYIVVAPSATEQPYTWELAPGDMAVAPAAGWLLGLIAETAPPRPVQPAVMRQDQLQRLETLARFVARAPEGNRNNVLYWAAMRTVEEWIPTSMAAPALSLAAQDAGCTLVEIDATLRSAFDR
jgi:hypothetical protein